MGWCTEVQPHTKWKVLTGIVGFVNDFTRIARAPNAALELNKDVPLGERTLFLKTTALIKPNTEILLDYGDRSEFVRRTPKRQTTPLPGATKKTKTAIVGILAEAGGVGGASQPATAAVAEAGTDAV